MNLSRFGMMLFVVFFVAHSFAEETVIEVNPLQAAGLLVGSGGAAGSSIYAAVKYREASLAEKEAVGIESVLKHSPGLTDTELLGRTTRTFRPGDEIGITYIPTEEEYRSQMLFELQKTEAKYQEEGHKLSVEMDVKAKQGDMAGARSVHELAEWNYKMAKEMREHMEYYKNARPLRVLPQYIWIKDSLSPDEEAYQRMREKIGKGARIVEVNKISGKMAERARNAIAKGKAGLAGIALSGGVLLGDILTMNVSSSIESSQKNFIPSRAATGKK